MAKIIPNLIILGPQGSGKSTQAKLLTDRYGYVHISTGNLIRERIKKHDLIAKKIQKNMDKGKLIDINILFDDIIKPYITKFRSKRIIFDGIPRNLSQLIRLNKLIKILGIDKPYLLYIDVPRKIVLERISKRLICPVCNTVYKPGQRGYSKALCPKDHKKLIQRNDDRDIVALNKRLEVFIKYTKKIFPYFIKNKHFIKIDGTKTIVEVDKQIRNILEHLC